LLFPSANRGWHMPMRSRPSCCGEFCSLRTYPLTFAFLLTFNIPRLSARSTSIRIVP
jgi:hypothetical protein